MFEFQKQFIRKVTSDFLIFKTDILETTPNIFCYKSLECIPTQSRIKTNI